MLTRYTEEKIKEFKDIPGTFGHYMYLKSLEGKKDSDQKKVRDEIKKYIPARQR